MNLTERSKKAQDRLNKAGLNVDAAYDELVAATTAYVAARLAEQEEIRSRLQLAAAAEPPGGEGVESIKSEDL